MEVFYHSYKPDEKGELGENCTFSEVRCGM